MLGVGLVRSCKRFDTPFDYSGPINRTAETHPIDWLASPSAATIRVRPTSVSFGDRDVDGMGLRLRRRSRPRDSQRPKPSWSSDLRRTNPVRILHARGQSRTYLFRPRSDLRH